MLYPSSLKLLALASSVVVLGCRRAPPTALGAVGSAVSASTAPPSAPDGAGSVAPRAEGQDAGPAASARARADAGAADAAEGAVRFERRKLRAFLDRVRTRVLHAEGGDCAHEEQEYAELGKQLDWIVPSAPGNLEQALMAAARCIRCGQSSRSHRSRDCVEAVEALDRAQAWADSHGR